MRQREVVAKRGCTCCGTGCAVIGAIVPAAAFLAFESFGLMAAIVVWPALIAAAHGLRFARRNTDDPAATNR